MRPILLAAQRTAVDTEQTTARRIKTTRPRYGPRPYQKPLLRRQNNLGRHAVPVALADLGLRAICARDGNIDRELVAFVVLIAHYASQVECLSEVLSRAALRDI